MQKFLCLWFFSPLALAGWQVDPGESHVGFASVKNDVIAENHSFTRVTGGVSDTGEARVDISLDSVETFIPIRNERMRSLLFKTGRYPLATVTGQVDVANFISLPIGESRVQVIDISISLHGAGLDKSVPVKVTRLASQRYEVASLGPVVIYAPQFSLLGGVEALRDIAGLQSIELMVPLTFNLRLTGN